MFPGDAAVGGHFENHCLGIFLLVQKHALEGQMVLSENEKGEKKTPNFQGDDRVWWT